MKMMVKKRLPFLIIIVYGIILCLFSLWGDQYSSWNAGLFYILTGMPYFLGVPADVNLLFENGKVEALVTVEDLLFSSSSAAANFVLGYSVSGPQPELAEYGA